MGDISDAVPVEPQTQREWLLASIADATTKHEEGVRHGGRVGIAATYWKGVAETLTITLRKLDRGDWT